MAEDKPRKRGLGRGLDALFGESEAAAAVYGESAPAPDAPAAGDGGAGGTGGGAEAPSTAARGTRTVPIERIRPTPNQPRRHFDDGAIDGLVASIREQGLLQPLLVRPDPEQPEGYQIVAGERRWRAAQRAQLHEVPVVVKELGDSDALAIALIENIHREALTPLEESDAYRRLMEEFGHTQDALARAVGKSRSHIANMLRLLGLPEGVRAMIDDGRLSAGHARALIGADDPDAVAAEVVRKGLNVRQTEALVQRAKPQSGMKRLKRAIAEKDPDTRALEQRLADNLGLKVDIELSGDGESGRLVVRFADFDQLDDLATRLGRSPAPAAGDVEM